MVYLPKNIYIRFVVFYFVFFFTVAVFSPYFSLFLASRGLNSAQVGLVMAVMPFVGILLQPVWGIINDRFYVHKWTIATGLLVVSGALFLMTSGHGVFDFVLLAMVIALFQPVLIPLNDSLTLQVAGVERYGKIRLFGSLGYAVFIVFDSFVIHRIGVKYMPLLYLAAGVLAIAPGLLLLPRQPRKPFAQTIHPYSGLHRLMRNRRFILLLIFTLLIMVGQGMNNNFFTLYYVHLHRPMTLLGTVYAMAALSEMPFFFMSGRLIARFGAERIFLLATGVFILRWLTLGFGPATWVIVLVQLFSGMSFGLSYAAGIAIARQASDETNHATAQTVFSAVNSGIASIIGSAVGGVILQQLGPKAIYLGAAASSIVGFLAMAWFVWRKQPVRELSGDAYQ